MKEREEITVQCASLTDDQLWDAIVRNTNEMSALIERQFAVETYIGANERDKKADLMRSHLETVNKFQREYRD